MIPGITYSTITRVVVDYVHARSSVSTGAVDTIVNIFGKGAERNKRHDVHWKCSIAPLSLRISAVCYDHVYIICNLAEVQVSRLIIVLLLQNCFVWYKDNTHQAILTIQLLKLELWQLSHWLPELFLSKMRFLDILVVFRLDFGQISFNLAQKPFATQQSFLPLASRFTAFRLGHAQKSNVWAT